MTPNWKEQLLALPDQGREILTKWRKSKAYQRLQWAGEKPGIVPGAMAAFCLSLAMLLTNQYQVVIDGQVLGVVHDRQQIAQYVKDMDDHNREKYSSQLALINDVKIARSFGTRAQDAEDLQVVLYDRLNWGTEAAVIKVNGEEVVALADVTTAESVLDRIRQKLNLSAAKGYSAYKQLSLGLAEQVEVVAAAVTVDRVTDEKTAEQILLEGKSSLTRYVVSRGDTLSGIAVSRGVSMGTLTAANPGIKATRLKIGQSLNLNVSEPYLHVQETAEVVKKQAIPYETRVIKDDSMWNWQTKTITPGKEGTQEVTAVVTLVNGKVSKEQVLSSKVLSEPTGAVVKQGAKQAAVQGTGHFIWPTNGRLTSGYGWRWGKVHRAADIGASQGTPIYAADGGVVVSAGWRSSYGYVVEIDHGNGYHTLYAHCSKLLVTNGQKVSQGQTIAAVGHTGFATGSHVHFEVIKNGNQVNPLSYFK